MLETFLVLAVILADQFTKYLSVKYLKPVDSIVVIKDILNFSYVENRGAAFGILQNKRWLFIILTIIICIAIIYYIYTYRAASMLLKICLSLILGGALGNLIDRIRVGYVVDMIHFTFINYPVFNIADISVVIGTILLAYFLLFVDAK